MYALVAPDKRTVSTANPGFFRDSVVKLYGSRNLIGRSLVLLNGTDLNNSPAVAECVVGVEPVAINGPRPSQLYGGLALYATTTGSPMNSYRYLNGCR